METGSFKLQKGSKRQQKSLKTCPHDSCNIVLGLLKAYDSFVQET